MEHGGDVGAPPEGEASALQRLLGQTVQHEADELARTRLQLRGREVHFNTLTHKQTNNGFIIIYLGFPSKEILGIYFGDLLH